MYDKICFQVNYLKGIQKLRDENIEKNIFFYHKKYII